KIDDFDFLPTGHDLIIPLPYVVRVKAARKENLLIRDNGKLAEIYFPDGNHRKVFRNDKGAAVHVEDRDQNGQLTIYRKEDKGWLVMNPGETGFSPYKEHLLTDC